MTDGPSIAPPMLGKGNARLARLRDIVQRRVEGLTVIDGVKLTLDLAERGIDVLEIYLTAERLAELVVHPCVAAAAQRGRLFQVSPTTLARIAPTRSPQGLLAVVAVPRHDLEAEGIVLFLDRVQDPGNVGAVIRNAAAFGAGGVACSPGCGDPFSPRAVRGSAGAALLLPVVADADFTPLADAVSARGGEVAAAVGSGGVSAAHWHSRLPLLLVLGNEGGGISDEVLALCSTRVTMPLASGIESLNVASATAAILAGLVGVVPSPILELKSEIRRSR